METFLDKLNSNALTKNSEEALKREFIEYVDNVAFPYWIEREYGKIKEEIEKKAKLGEFKIESQKKVIEGKFSLPCYSYKYHKTVKEIDNYIYLKKYGDKNEPPLFAELRNRGIEQFGTDFDCKATAKIEKKFEQTLISFKYATSPNYRADTEFHFAPIGEIEWKKETHKKGLFKKYEVDIPIAVKLTSSFKEACKAFTQIAQKDSVKIGWGFIELLDIVGKETNEIVLNDFNKEIRFRPAWNWNIDSRMDSEELPSRKFSIETEILGSIFLSYRVEF